METFIMENSNLFSQQDFKNMVMVGDITQADYNKVYGNNQQSQSAQPAANNQQNSNSFNAVD